VCFDLDSAPPVHRIRGASVTHEELVLEAADGNRLAAFAAVPDSPAVVGVVILPDVRGLYRFYEELALRFAERGIAAVAIDFFGRTAGVERRGDDFEYMPHVERTTLESVQADVAAAVAHLRSGGVETVFTVGFCFGGRHSWLAAETPPVYQTATTSGDGAWPVRVPLTTVCPRAYTRRGTAGCACRTR
jgi:carboxymethylenebutenolidase